MTNNNENVSRLFCEDIMNLVQSGISSVEKIKAECMAGANRYQKEHSKRLEEQDRKQKVAQVLLNACITDGGCGCDICKVTQQHTCDEIELFSKVSHFVPSVNKRLSTKKTNNFILELQRNFINYKKDIHYAAAKRYIVTDLFSDNPKSFLSSVLKSTNTISTGHKFCRHSIMFRAESIEAPMPINAATDLYNFDETIKLPAFQTRCKNGKLVPLMDYKVTEINTSFRKKYKYLQYKNKIIRIGCWSITKLSGILPYRDCIAILFKDEFENINFATDNYIGTYTFECIPNKNNKLGLNNDIGFTDVHTLIGTIQLKENVSDNVKMIFEAKSLSQDELYNLFNPRRESQLKTPAEIKELPEPQPSEANEQVVRLSDSESDDDNVEGEPADNIASIESENNDLDWSFPLINYNKNYQFQKDEKIMIADVLKNLLQNNEKIRKLFLEYTDINIIKPISKAYTAKRYINIILFNKPLQLVSQQYHLYIDEKNIVTGLTAITNLL